MEKGFLEKGFKDLKQLMEGIYSVWALTLVTMIFTHNIRILDENPLQYA